jgi:pimeloyl-ACP methyl ester carboxylesterase
MRRVEVRRDDVVLSCLVGGSGDAVVVLLHGLAGSAQEMWPTAETLAADHRVVAVDQRGHGRSTRRPADLSRRAYVEDVAAVVREVAGGGPVTLVGQSMGGHTAMLVAARHPGLVGGLVMAEAGVGGGPGDYPARLGDWFASWPVPFADARAAAAFLGTGPIARAWVDDLEERDGGLWPRFEPGVMRAAIATVAERECWPQWRGVRAPTLVVTGENGKVGAPELRRMLTVRPDAAHVTVPAAGHDLHLEQPAAWIRVLREFLGRGGC